MAFRASRLTPVSPFGIAAAYASTHAYRPALTPWHISCSIANRKLFSCTYVRPVQDRLKLMDSCGTPIEKEPQLEIQIQRVTRKPTQWRHAGIDGAQ